MYGLGSILRSLAVLLRGLVPTDLLAHCRLSPNQLRLLATCPHELQAALKKLATEAVPITGLVAPVEEVCCPELLLLVCAMRLKRLPP